MPISQICPRDEFRHAYEAYAAYLGEIYEDVVVSSIDLLKNCVANGRSVRLLSNVAVAVENCDVEVISGRYMYRHDFIKVLPLDFELVLF